MLKWKKSILLFVASIKSLKTLKHQIFSKKRYFFLSIICSKCGNEDEKIFKEEESIVILKILGLIINIEKYQNNLKFILR